MNNRILVFLLIQVNLIFSQTSTKVEVVDSDGNPIPNAFVKMNEEVNFTDFDGLIIKDINLVPTKFLIRSVGFNTLDTLVNFEKYQSEIIFKLQESNSMALNEFVVTGNGKPTYVSRSPMKVNVLSNKFLIDNIAPTNIVESISMMSGLQEVVGCGVCFTNSISINGLDGKYTSILIDGNPMYGSLASVYGLNGIPNEIIDRIEVIKGPNSTLYGSDAIAGIINVITKDVDEQPIASFNHKITTHGEVYNSGSFALNGKKVKSLLSLDHALSHSFDDQNNDGFNDIINMDRYSVFSKNQFIRKSNKIFELSGKFYYEDRRNGVEDYLKTNQYKDLRGDDSIYGESILTQRVELFGKYEFNTKQDLFLNYSWSTHNQDSYYGDAGFEAFQNILFSSLIWNKSIKRHDFTSGLTFRYEYYDDNTIVTQELDEDGFSQNKSLNSFVPGAFIQDDYSINDKLSLLTGIRLDYDNNHGEIITPSINLKYSPSNWTTFRLNSASGFKVVNLFTEDHAFVTGQRNVLIEEALNPEKSINTTLNINHIFGIGKSTGTIDIDIYYTYFFNQINPDYSQNNLIKYSNSDGNNTYRGVNFNVTQQIWNRVNVNAGVSLLDAFEMDDLGIKSKVLFAPDWTGTFSFNYNLKKWNTLLALTSQATGKMALPEVFDLDDNGNVLSESRPTRSETFATFNFQITKKFKKYLDVYIGSENILNNIQSTPPLAGYNDPNFPVGFSPNFDTSYAYASTHGREFYIGVRYRLNKKGK